jgi:hypothetical protein
MFVIHLAMGIFLTVLFKNRNKINDEYDLYNYSITLGEKIGEYNDEGDAYNEFELNWRSKKDKVIKVSVEKELISFFYITSFFHLFYFLNPMNIYSKMIENQNNWIRWIEYSITATLMIRIIAILSGVRDQFTISLLTTMTFCIMLLGQVGEKSLSIYNTSKSTSKSIDSFLSLAKFSTLIGWVLMIIVFYTIVQQYLYIKDSIDDLPCQGVKIPDFVTGVIISQVFLFSLFGFVQLYQIFNNVQDYNNIEKSYIFLSFLSKVVLGSLLAYGELNSENARSIDCPSQ